jgi:hypothetical protein
VQNAAASNVLVVDTTNSRIGIAGAPGNGALTVSGTPVASATSAMLQLGSTALAGASASGTYIGVNQAGTADFLDFQVSNISKFWVTSAGSVYAAGTLTLGGGQSKDITTGTFAYSTGTSSMGLTIQTANSDNYCNCGAKSGNLNLYSGAQGSYGNAGDVNLDTGGTVTPIFAAGGTVNIGTTNANAMNIGRSALTTNIKSATTVFGTGAGTVSNIRSALGNDLYIDTTPDLTNYPSWGEVYLGTANALDIVIGRAGGYVFPWMPVGGTVGVCFGGNGTVQSSAANGTAGYKRLNDCIGTPSDYAESYPVAQGVKYGDIVANGTELVDTYAVNDFTTQAEGDYDWSKPIGKVTKMVKTNSLYQANTVGIVSENNHDFTSTGHNIKAEDNPMPVALNGRVPVNIAPDSPAIEPGDFITTSGTHAGKGTKATGAGYIVGKALEAWDPASGKTQLMVFVQNGFYPGPSMTSYIQNGGNASLSNLDVTGTANFGDINMSGVANLNELKVVTATVSGNLEVKGLLKVADIEVNGHIITKGDTPGIAAETNAGKDAVCSVSGNDTSGKITITTGTADWANGAQCTITFKKPYSANPNPVITPAYVLGATTDTSAIKPYVDADTNTMRINFNAADNAPRTYIFNYFNAQ